MKFIFIKTSANKTPNRFYSQPLKSCLAAALLLSANGLANAAPLTSWDKKINNVEQRFKALPELGGVLDNETQLIWEQLPEYNSDKWDWASRHCNQLKLGNRFGWRLPTLAELTTLLDVSSPTNFPNSPLLVPPPDGIWTSTQTNLGSNGVWAIDTGYGIAFKTIKDNANHGAWCVRGKHPGYN